MPSKIKCTLSSVVCAILFSTLLSGFQAKSQSPLAPEATVATRITQPIDEGVRTTLKGSVNPLATAANDRGEVAEGTPLGRIHMVLRRSDSQEKALNQLIQDVHTPTSPNYHKWLTPEQFGQQFGPSDKDIAAVETWLQSHGFAVKQVNPGKQTIEFSGNAGQFREAFHAAIHNYQINGKTRMANSSDPEIPAALAPVLGGFVSLNNFPLNHSANVLGKASYDPKADQATPAWTTANSPNDAFAMAPGDFSVQYDLGPLYTAGVNGTGQTVAIVSASNVNVDLVNQFRTLFNLPYNPPQVIIDGNDPGVDGVNNPFGANGSGVEAYLDVEWAGAVAPNATIDLVTAADTELESGLALAAEHAVYSNVAPVLNMNVETCERLFNSDFADLLWEQAAAQGITVVISSGDEGSAGCDFYGQSRYAVHGQAVNGWASTPYNVAVGGTDFYYSSYANSAALNTQLATYWNTTVSQLPAVSLKGVVPEQAWNDSQYGLNIVNIYTCCGSSSIEAGGGGASNAAVCTSGQYDGSGNCTVPLVGYPKPSWQAGTGVPTDGVRDLPDVSLFGGDGDNYSFYPICAGDGDCQTPTGSNSVQITGVGGTSASAAAFSGIMALVNQQYGRQGQADFVLYPLKAQYPAAFHDVTVGTNSVPCNITTATVGTTTYPANNCIAVTNPVTITDYTYGLATEGQIGTGTTPEYNAATGYDLATGLGSVDANVLVTDWPKVTFTATGTTLTPSSTAFTAGTSITVSGTVTAASGTPTGQVALMTDNTETNQQGLAFFTLTNGAFSGSVSNLPGGTYNIWGVYSGDTNNAASTSLKVPITVSPENSGVNLAITELNGNGTPNVPSGTTGIPYGTTLSSDAIVTLSGGSPESVIATGTVTFKDGSTTLNTALVNAAGQASFLTSSLSTGSHSITASYSGDSTYNASTSAAISFSIAQVTPSVYITVPGNPYTQGQQSVLTVLVEGSGGTPPTGSVTLTGAPAGTPTTATLVGGYDPVSHVSAGTATFVIPSTAVAGTYTIGASYTPDASSTANFTAASATALSLQITAAAGIATTTTGTASLSATSPNSIVNIYGTVTAASGSAPLGTVSLLAGYVSGSKAAEAIYTDSLLQATGTSSTFNFPLSSSTLPPGTTQFTVYYSGNATDAPSAAVVTVSNPESDFTLTPQLPEVNVVPGTPATDTINLTSMSGFSGAVTLTCTAQTGVTCTVPPSVTLTSGGSTTAALGINAPTTTAVGDYNVQVTGTDSTGTHIHTAGVEAIVKPTTTLAISTTSPLLSAMVGRAYSTTLAGTGGSKTGYTWSVTSGASSLAAVGLSLSSAGVLSGATPVVGTATFTAQLKDSYLDAATTTFTVTVLPALVITTPSTLPTGIANKPYSQTFAATGGTGAGYAWAVTGGAPNLGYVGLNLSSAGVLSTTSLFVNGTANFIANFTVTVTDTGSNYMTAANFSVTVDPALAVSTTTMPAGIVGTAYSQPLAALGGSESGYTWSVTSGGSSLSAIGLSLSSAGVLSGATPEMGTASFTVKVTDSASDTATANVSVTIYPTIAISTATVLPGATVGVAYSQPLTATGGSGTGYTWTVTSGGSSLTAVGLSLSGTGILSGSSPILGSANFTAKVTDSNSNSTTANFTVTVYKTLTITSPATLPSGDVGSAYSQTLGAAGGSGTGYTWTVTTGASSLSAIGLSLSSTGALTGSAPIVGSASFSVKVTDSASNTATANLSVTIDATLAITTTSPLVTGISGVAYSQTLAAAGGSGTGYTWTVASGESSLAALGLSLSSTGVLAGPAPAAGTATFTVKVTDSNSGTATANFSLTVNPPLSISTTSTTLPNGVAGIAYSQTLVATGGTGTGYSWSVTSGASSLTAVGLSLSGAGVLSGSSPIAGSANFTVTVKDSGLNSASANFSVTINIPPSFAVSGTNVSLAPGATTGNTSTVTVTPSGGFAGSIVLTATVANSTGTAYPPTVSFGSTGTVSITGASPVTATLTISTTAATSASMAVPRRPGMPWYATGGATLACLVLLGIPGRRRRWQTMLGMVLLLVALGSGMLACGGTAKTTTTNTGTPGTAAGTYMITVTGTPTTGSPVTATVTLTVQ